jgi:hypothetical protein
MKTAIAYAVLCTLLSVPINGARPSYLQSASGDKTEIVHHIDAAVALRAKSIAHYTVQEQYDLYRNTDTTPAAQETIQTTYDRATGKQYTVAAQSGSSFLRSAVIDKLLAGEKDLNLPANREASWLTSSNYQMQPQSGTVQINNRTCILVIIKPLRKSPHLFDGKLWVDSADFTIVRLEGTPSQSPSFFAGQSTVARDYAKFDGFAMATHAEGHSHSFLFGDTTLKIDYTNYKIETLPTQ